MELNNKIILGLAISVFVLFIQNHEAFAAKVIITEQGDNAECRSGKSCFLPSNMVIKEGQVVTWFNADSSTHSIMTQSRQFGSSGIITSGDILPGESYSHRFDTSEYVNYYCVLHPWMEGLVIVD